MKLTTGALALIPLLAVATTASAQEVTEITVSTEACLDEVVRQERCRSFEVDATIEQIAELFAPSSVDGVQWIIHVNGWEGVSAETVIKRGVFIRTV